MNFEAHIHANGRILAALRDQGGFAPITMLVLDEACSPEHEAGLLEEYRRTLAMSGGDELLAADAALRWSEGRWLAIRDASGRSILDAPMSDMVRLTRAEFARWTWADRGDPFWLAVMKSGRRMTAARARHELDRLRSMLPPVVRSFD